MQSVIGQYIAKCLILAVHLLHIDRGMHCVCAADPTNHRSHLLQMHLESLTDLANGLMGCSNNGPEPSRVVDAGNVAK